MKRRGRWRGLNPRLTDTPSITSHCVTPPTVWIVLLLCK